MKNTLLISVLLLASPVFAQENSCSTTGEASANVSELQKCLQMECPSETPEQVRSLGNIVTGPMGLMSSLSKFKGVFLLEQKKAPTLSCSGDCKFQYVPRFRLNIAPEKTIATPKCEEKYLTTEPFHLEYNLAVAFAKGKGEISCRKLVEDNAQTYIRNILQNHSDKVLNDEKSTYNGQAMSGVTFAKKLASELCPGDCSLYSTQATTYLTVGTACTVNVKFDISCGKAKESMSWTVNSEIAESYQCKK
jgi:hypothetical protein